MSCCCLPSCGPCCQPCRRPSCCLPYTGRCSECGCETCNGMQLCPTCMQKRASLVRRQCILPRTSNPCIRPCCPPQCIDTYSGCRAFRPRYDIIRNYKGCCPQVPPSPKFCGNQVECCDVAPPPFRVIQHVRKWKESSGREFCCVPGVPPSGCC